MNRYDPDIHYIGTGEHIGVMVEAEDGDYVAYEDADRLRAENEAHQWRQIDTAPRDRSPVLLRGSKGRHADGFWEPEAYGGNGSWIWPYIKAEPTHWMPLPEPPKLRGEGDTNGQS